MKTYKHKTLPCVAMRHEDENTVVSMVQVNLFNESIIRPVKDIENSSDRIEVVEKDWIDNLYEKIPSLNDKILFREYIEKHAPQVKKFTKEEIVEWMENSYYDGYIENYFAEFLKEHNLLSIG